MGRGDKSTKRGKIAAGSFGKTRPKKKNLKKAAPETVKENKTETKETA